MKNLRILITNDDGIHAPGLEALERIARTLSDDVWVVAPEVEQSGASHSLTLHLPVRLREISPKRYAVSGTPTDCVLLALQQIMPKKQRATLVLSGVNNGSNAGDDVTYSGTIAGAMEGTLLGVKSIALSQLTDDRSATRWATAEKHAPALIKKLIALDFDADTLMNLNFPNCPANKVKGTIVCPQGKRLMRVALTERRDPKNRAYFWLGGERDNQAEKPGVDIDYLHSDYITVTPLSIDLTAQAMLTKLKTALK